MEAKIYWLISITLVFPIIWLYVVHDQKKVLSVPKIPQSLLIEEMLTTLTAVSTSNDIKVSLNTHNLGADREVDSSDYP